MEWLQNFHFMRPYLLVLLILPLFYAWKTMNTKSFNSSWAKVCDEHLLAFLLLKGNKKSGKFSKILVALITILIITAASGPTWVKRQNPALSVDNPVMLIISLSSDMWTKDVSPSRIVRAQYLAKDLLKEFKSTESGLMVYSREPFMLTPLTEDTGLVENLLPEIIDDIMPENGDRLDRAIDLAVERMSGAGYEKGNLIVLTADVGERFDAALESANLAKEKGFNVNIIKVSGIKNEKLRMVAEKGNGIYLDYKQNPAPLVARINDVYAQETRISQNMQTVWEDMGYYLFWLPAFLLLYYFRRGLIAVLLLALFSSDCYAGWFLNNNQEAMRYFNNGDYSAASDKFTDAKWRASAAYKSGDYEKAYENFSQYDDKVSLYNQGNALAKAGKIEEAMAKYEQVLSEDADFEDAAFNLDYLKKLQQQQQQQQQQQKQQQQEKNNQKQEQKTEQNSGGDNSQSAEAQEDDNKQENQGENNQQSSEAQNGDDNQNTKAEQKDSSENSEGGEKSDKQEEQGKEQKNSASANSEDKEGSETSADVNMQAQYGRENEKSEQEAEALMTQAGDKSAEEKEKIRARLQKFREIPEDKGGLLRAIIAKEYSRNRSKDRK